MTAEVSIGDREPARLTPHPLRTAILGELHARPFTALTVPARILHFAFDTAGERAQTDRVNLAKLCEARGLPVPTFAERHYRVAFGTTVLRWEQHSEFTTYTWEMPSPTDVIPFHPAAAALAAPMQLVPQPGPLIVAIDMHVLADGPAVHPPERLFGRNSLAIAENYDGAAIYATDFQLDPSGFVRILVVDRNLNPDRAGALAQRVIEIETYRTLALLGLSEA